ncbi:hypothetical protein K9M06_01085 [Candidatus Bipolaricaulota bacterium]|nr:hypothetical protein [Candidatus Bipolaricaulota bacterium]
MKYFKEPICKGDLVRITRTCPYYPTFAEKVGWVRQVDKDSIGGLYLVEIRDGEKVYLRRSEFDVLHGGKVS